MNKIEKTKNNAYQNPLMVGADPFVLNYNGKYYLYATNTDDGFRVYVSENMAEWRDMGYCLKKGDVIGERWFWAPEVMEKDGKFYMVYTSEEHLAIATADNPLGPFVQTEKKWLSEEKAIDGHFFADDDGSVYLYYVRFDGGNVIYMSKMNEEISCLDEGNERFLLRADEEWEIKDCEVAEGPFVLKHNGKYYLTYSANHTRSEDYAIGYAVSDSPFGPFRKYKGNPILHKTEDVNGTGHHSFVRSLDGEELICVYHRHQSKRDFQPRMVCVDRAEFTSNDGGDDILVIYGPTTTPQKSFGMQ
ncbi:MAG: glycoside hydrolase family 43 protein [Clostridia bacterium]|nr:glycoside hydrolase family 43 protein [Clostridia bacterium]